MDEAGKGSVLGPMVVAAVGCGSLDDLAALPVRDSKDLSAKQRERLYEVIVRDFGVAVITIDAAEIDETRSRMSMNACVAELHAEALTGLRPDCAYLDACDVNAERFARTVGAHLTFPCRIIAEHHADSVHKIVGAASIVAKVTRDRAVRDLAVEYGDIGSGYPSDRKTIGFLKGYIKTHGLPPACARKTWKTVTNLYQRSIAEF